MFRAYIEGESETVTDSPRIARAAYEELLARDDLIGCEANAVLERDGATLFVSRFSCPIGQGRIHPAAPIDVFADRNTVATWQPAVC